MGAMGAGQSPSGDGMTDDERRNLRTDAGLDMAQAMKFLKRAHKKLRIIHPLSAKDFAPVIEELVRKIEFNNEMLDL